MESELDRYAREFLDDGKVPNPSSWLTADKEWMGNRKKAWQEIKKRLVDKNMSHVESDGATPKRKLRIYEKYFLKGELPAFDPLSDVPVCLLFLVWWHPDDSDSNWQLIKKVIRHIGGEYSRSHYSDSVNMLIKNSGPMSFVVADGYSHSFFLGNEERLFNYFINDDVENRLIAFDSKQPQVKFADRGQVVYLGGVWMTQWLTAPSEYINKYTIYQYDRYLEYWIKKLTDESLERIFRRERSEESLRKFLSLIVKHPSSDRVVERVVYVNKVRNILDNRPLESIMNRIWSEVNDTAGM